MVDVYSILNQKERDLARVSREVECLKTIIPLLTDEEDTERPVSHVLPEPTGTEGGAVGKSGTRFSIFGRRKG